MSTPQAVQDVMKTINDQLSVALKHNLFDVTPEQVRIAREAMIDGITDCYPEAQILKINFNNIIVQITPVRSLSFFISL